MSSPSRFDRHVVVDMTPLDPGGENGGAGLVATSLVRNMSALDPRSRLTLLTADVSHHELTSLDRQNVQRRCVVQRSSTPRLVMTVLDRVLSPTALVRVRGAYHSLRASRRAGQTIDGLRPDLLFCPFTVPYFWQPHVPCISVVHDLQHFTYPEFFSAEQQLNRTRQIQDALTRSERVVCVSEYVRQTLLANYHSCTERVVTIRLGVLHGNLPSDQSILLKLGVKENSFLLYPANFWPHKNHRRLFEALRTYRALNPDSQLRLVCTGAPNDLMRTLASEISADLVVFAGYVSEAQLLALYDACTAVIFPSLYEGFGMPVLEAMARGKPVLCSNVTSLPEIAGDATVYFHPADTRQIAGAIERLHDQAAMAELVKRGRSRAAFLGTGREMAEGYLALFDEVRVQASVQSRSAATRRPAS